MSVEEGTGPRGVRAPRFVRAADGDGRPAKPVLGATTMPWVLDLIERHRAARGSLLICTHLAEDPDQGAVWSASVPDLRRCRRAECAEAVAAVLEERLGHPPQDEPTRCTTCGRVGVAVRGVGVAVGTTMLRGTVCDDCLAARPIPTPAAATEVGASVTLHRPIEVDEEPVAADPEVLDAAQDRVPFDAVGRRALRRGRLMAEACGKETGRGLDADQAVLGGLLVRAAKLAAGLSHLPRADGSYVDDLGYRALVETTTHLWWLLRTDAVDGAATYRRAGVLPAGWEDLRDRLEDLGRADDLATLLGPTPDAVPGSWRELTARHLTVGPVGAGRDPAPPAGPGRDRESQARSAPAPGPHDGSAQDPGPHEAFAPHLGHVGRVGPLQVLVVGEHLAQACADYVARMPTTLDPDHIRWLADELTALRRVVEPAFAEAVAEGRITP